jgi:glycerol-3-phosphate O-acyltransferase
MIGHILDPKHSNRVDAVKPEDREAVLVEVVQRVVDRWSRGPHQAEEAVLDTLYEERRRLEAHPNSADTPERAALYERVRQEAAKAAPERQRELLRLLVEGFAEEVRGSFDPGVYNLATRAIPPALNVLLNALSPLRLLESLPGGGGRLDQQLELIGETASVQALSQRGTLMFVPTHASHLDSVLMGLALFQLGLPPVLYGAGLNLFDNPLIGFFMRHVGAYRVDRTKRAAVYKDVLKAYAGCTLERGYHQLFFPGGTRSRSGAVERHLKMGLLGMGLDAYSNNVRSGKARPDVFVVPCTLNYQLVLEAETLIEDFLKEAGKSRYIIEDDEFSRPRRVLEFTRRLFTLDSRVHLAFGRPLDVFGNPVDPDGTSRDARGRPVERLKYLLRDGQVVADPQRDAEYTIELAEAVAASFQRDTVVKATNLLSHVAFGLLRERQPRLDLYRLLRAGAAEESLHLPEVYRRLDQVLGQLVQLRDAGKLKLDQALTRRDSVALVGQALAHLGSYHRRPALYRRGDRLFSGDRSLLLYYGNRLARHAALEVAA